MLLKYTSQYEFTGWEWETARAANTVAASTRALNDYMYYMYDIHRPRESFDFKLSSPLQFEGVL